jgi:RHS repeat-associated protein
VTQGRAQPCPDRGPYGLLWSSNPNTVYTPGFGHRSNGINSFYQVDWLGSTRYITDITGTSVLAAQSYDAWGHRDVQATGSPNHPTDMQFAGGWGYQTEWSNGASEPGLGLDYLQQRYYDPVIGRFISPDPLGLTGGLNLYRYLGDDSVNGVDPTGLIHTDPESHGGGGAGDVSGGDGGLLISEELSQLFERVAEKIRWPKSLKWPWSEGAEGTSAEEAGCPSFRAEIGKAFENALRAHYGGAGEFRVWNGFKDVTFDGAFSPDFWYEAKSGGYWQKALSEPDVLSKFKFQVDSQMKAAELWDASYRVISNSPIPNVVKAWLDTKGIGYVELLH